MLKNISNFGKALSKEEQKGINGAGRGFCCEWCPDGTCNGWVSSPLIPCPFALAC